MSDPKKLAAALENLPGSLAPKMDLVGPTAADDVRRAIGRYGADAVKAALKDATKAKRGRKLEPDWVKLAPIFKADARRWLDGGDPFTERSNYSIAKEFAEKNPGQSAVSTHQRIERKLRKSRQRVTLITAENISRNEFSYLAHLRAMEALAALPKRGAWPDLYPQMRDRARAKVADYEAREGSPPDAKMTMKEVEDAVERRTREALRAPSIPAGLFGQILQNAIEGGE